MRGDDMEIKQSTWEEIIESERQLVLGADTRYGKYSHLARACSIFLSRSIVTVDFTRHETFGRLFALLKKHHMLALLSTLRLHKVQSMMNLRQTLEAGAAAAFAIANAEREHFVDIDANGILDPAKALAGKRYRWLETNFPKSSESIKSKKDQINVMTSHANIVSANQTFRVNERRDWIAAPFFDVEDDYYVKGDLWFITSIAIDLMDLLYQVNEGHGAIEFMSDFPAYLMHTARENAGLHAEITSTDRYKQAIQRMQT